MFFEQYSHEPYVALARFCLGYAPEVELEKKRHLVHQWHAKDNAALGVMPTHPAAYPAVRSWLERVASQPGYIPLAESCWVLAIKRRA